MGFSFQSLGQLGLFQSLLGAGPAVAGQGTGLPGGVQGDGPFSALLQQALSTPDTGSFSGSGSFKDAAAPFAGAADGVLQSSPIFLRGLPAEQNLAAAPYGLDEVYDPQAVPTDVLNAAIADTPSAFNTTIATALRTQTIKTTASPAEPSRIAQKAVPLLPVQASAPQLPPATQDILPQTSAEPLDAAEPLPEEPRQSAPAQDAGTQAQGAAVLVAAAQASPAPVAVPVLVPTPSAAPNVAAEEADTGAVAVPATTTGTAKATSVATSAGPQDAGQTLELGAAGTIEAVPAQEKRTAARNKAEPEVLGDQAPKETRQRSVAQTDAGPERRSGSFTPQDQPATTIKPEIGTPAHAVTHRPAESAPATGWQAAPPVAQAAPAQAAHPAERPTPAYLQHAPASDQVGVAVARAAKDGRTEIHVRLDPAELGRVEVRLHFQADGEVRAQVTTDNPQTFDLLRRDSQVLERALQDAGLRTDSGSLSFNLRQQDNQSAQQHFARNTRNDTDSGAASRSDSPTVAALEAASQGRKPTSLFDVLA